MNSTLLAKVKEKGMAFYAYSQEEYEIMALTLSKTSKKPLEDPLKHLGDIRIKFYSTDGRGKSLKKYWA